MNTLPGVFSLKFPCDIKETTTVLLHGGTVVKNVLVNDVVVIFSMENDGNITIECNYEYSFDGDKMLFDPSKPRKMYDIILDKEY